MLGVNKVEKVQLKNSGKLHIREVGNVLGNSTRVHAHEVEKFYWSDLQNFDWRTLTIFHVHEVESLTEELYDILCPRSGKV